MSPELETLDQLLGGALPLRTIRGVYPNAIAFNTGVASLLAVGDVRLTREDGTEVSHWSWRELFQGELSDDAAPLMLDLTEQGTRKMSLRVMG